jgi:hypothetical protein
MTRRRYRIESLRGVEWLEPTPDGPTRRKEADPRRRNWNDWAEPLITSHGNWPDFRFSADEQAALEKRDAPAMAAAAARKARGETLPCPRVKYRSTYEAAKRGINATITVSAEVQDAGGRWAPGGELFAEKEGSHFAVNSSTTPLELLATCPGLGTGLYEEAMKLACKKSAVLGSSKLRSAFSERFWKRQLKKGRAVCLGSHAEFYNSPHYSLRVRLMDGRINVPQYNALVRGLPAFPDKGAWPCEYVTLKACGEKSLRGLRSR